jgi:A/G-specific adenine glycosylase
MSASGIVEVYNTSPLPAPTVADRIENWFAANQRPLPWRKTYDPYAIWVSEVMLQQTQMEVVLRYIGPFLETFADVRSLAAADEHDVLAAWSGMGYYRRARMLHAGARLVAERHGGEIPSSVDQLREIAGIGRYTAGAIASIAYNKRTPIVDGNVARVMSRLYAIDEVTASPALMRAAWQKAEELANVCDSPRDLNQGLMELGALVCRPVAPECSACPVRRFCATRSDALPRPKEKGAIRNMNIALLVITDRDGRILMRRESGALMTSMLHLPHDNQSLFDVRPLRTSMKDPVGSFRHTITNRRVTFTVRRAVLKQRIGADYAWIDRAEIGKFPHPSYVRKALRLAFG